LDKRKRSQTEAKYRSNRYYKEFYGKDAILTRLGHVNIVHLDHPSKKEIQKCTEEIMREEIAGEAFFDDCPLCREFQKQPYDIVYYGQDDCGSCGLRSHPGRACFRGAAV
jgi:hypothetical protein